MMIGKGIKYLRSLMRIIVLKIRYSNRIEFKIKNLKSLYIGKGVKIRISKGNVLSLGNNVYIEDYCSFECINGSIYIGENTFFNTNNKVVSLEKISIGSDCLFGPNIGIFDHDHRYDISDKPIISQGYNTKEINIGNNIWIGCNATITRGVNICDKVIVAANSVVTKNIVNKGVYGGVPAKLIKEL
ncbi:acyltransferase [Clostridium beijerinckii]|uniref:acyltransferase n=1 Tax=Clostridium beijerinckii TaxID=1520 RepID=UPI001F15D1DE|nr:acyltransferase [Clostridium beijerinckii]